MRLIEEQMNQAIINKDHQWAKDNTCVQYIPQLDESFIYLHGHHIATYSHFHPKVIPNLGTLAEWPTVTTKSRLRALGVDVYTRKHVTYVNGEAVN
tara:strand:- start:330 stop:617 length:288 start_codon:yes stop_codon:yes gene_type:complete